MLKWNNPPNNIPLRRVGFGLTSFSSLIIDQVFVNAIGQEIKCKTKNFTDYERHAEFESDTYLVEARILANQSTGDE